MMLGKVKVLPKSDVKVPVATYSAPQDLQSPAQPQGMMQGLWGRVKSALAEPGALQRIGASLQDIAGVNDGNNLRQLNQDMLAQQQQAAAAHWQSLVQSHQLAEWKRQEAAQAQAQKIWDALPASDPGKQMSPEQYAEAQKALLSQRDYSSLYKALPGVPGGVFAPSTGQVRIDPAGAAAYRAAHPKSGRGGGARKGPPPLGPNEQLIGSK